jgi:hypothetical protein
MSIFVNKLFIKDYKDKKDTTRMFIRHNNVRYKNTKDILIFVNKKTPPTIMSMEHELKHMYDFIKSDGDISKMKDYNLLSPFTNISPENDTNVADFFYIMYIIDKTEIDAFYHSDIRNFIEYKDKFKNDIKHYIKYCRLQKNLNFLNEHNFAEMMSKIKKKDKNDIINFYYTILKDKKKFMNLEGIKLKYEQFKEKIKDFLKDTILHDDYVEYTDEEIDQFYHQFEKEVEKKKKVYLKYIGRLFAYFN